MHERFWGFYNPSSQDAEDLSQYVLEQLGVILKGDFGKLIAQTCDGIAVMSVEKGGVQTVIKETYKNVLAYPVLNKERLRTELSVLYERKEFHQISETISPSNNNKQWAPKFPF
jgi:hypothetical protein